MILSHNKVSTVHLSKIREANYTTKTLPPQYGRHIWGEGNRYSSYTLTHLLSRVYPKRRNTPPYGRYGRGAVAEWKKRSRDKKMYNNDGSSGSTAKKKKKNKKKRNHAYE